MTIGQSLTADAPVDSLCKQRAAVDHEGGTTGQPSAHDACNQKAAKTAREQVSAGKTKRILRIAERAYAEQRALDHYRDHQADERPADRADALDEIAVQQSGPTRIFVLARTHRRHDVRLRHDANHAIDREYGNEPDTDLLRCGKR